MEDDLERPHLCDLAASGSSLVFRAEGVFTVHCPVYHATRSEYVASR